MMTLAPVNGVNVCEPVFVSEMDFFCTCVNFRTIYQVNILQQVIVINTILSPSDSGEVVCCINFTESNHVPNVLALSGFCASCIAHKLNES